jgi:hypothetical protein
MNEKYRAKAIEIVSKHESSSTETVVEAIADAIESAVVDDRARAESCASKVGFHGLHVTLSAIGAAALSGSTDPAIVGLSGRLADGRSGRGTAERIARSVRERFSWVPDSDPAHAEYVPIAGSLLERHDLDGDELCVLLASLLLAEGIPCRIGARKYDAPAMFSHPVVHWQDNDGGWNLIDPCSTLEGQAEHDGRMVAEIVVPIRRKP